MQRRFVEALRRAEIVTLVNAAATVDDLARELVEELGEAYEAEIVFVLETLGDERDWRALAELGISGSSPKRSPVGDRCSRRSSPTGRSAPAAKTCSTEAGGPR